ncbi:hypothetical protein D3C72_2534270 [compost metagenome]
MWLALRITLSSAPGKAIFMRSAQAGVSSSCSPTVISTGTLIFGRSGIRFQSFRLPV